MKKMYVAPETEEFVASMVLPLMKSGHNVGDEDDPFNAKRQDDYDEDSGTPAEDVRRSLWEE